MESVKGLDPVIRRMTGVGAFVQLTAKAPLERYETSTLSTLGRVRRRELYFGICEEDFSKRR